MREARNASHGLMDILADEERRGRRARRLLLATNSGEVPVSFYEVVRAVVYALLADPAALTERAW